MSRLIASVALLCAVTAGACANDAPAASRPRSAATVEILEPEANATVTADTFSVRIGLDGGRIVSETSRNLTPDEGHVHVSVDGEILSQTYGLTQRLDAPAPGKHLLQVEFVAKDHGPFNPRVIASVPFEVEG
ncbi:MAG: hypothetical protein ACRDKJ_03600 [Actinomycetota bacterium]